MCAKRPILAVYTVWCDMVSYVATATVRAASQRCACDRSAKRPQLAHCNVVGRLAMECSETVENAYFAV